MREKGIDGKLALEDLNILGEWMSGVRERKVFTRREKGEISEFSFMKLVNVVGS